MPARRQSAVSRLLDFAGGRGWMMPVACGLSAVSALLGVAPFACTWLVLRDLVAERPAAVAAAVSHAALGCGLALLSVALSCLSRAFSLPLATRVAENVRRSAARRLVRSAPLAAQGLTPAQFRLRLNEAADLALDVCARVLPDLAASTASLGASLALCVLMDFRLGATLLAAACAATLCLLLASAGGTSRAVARYAEAEAALRDEAQGYAGGLPTARLFQHSSWSYAALRDAALAFGRAGRSYALRVGFVPHALSRALLLASAAFLVPVAIASAPAAEDFPGFVAAFGFLALLTAPLASSLVRVALAAHDLTRADEARRRVDDLLSLPALPTPAHVRHVRDASVSFEHVSCPETSRGPALRRLTLGVPAGTSVALVGEGASVAVALVARQADPVHGVVRVGAADVRTVAEAELVDAVAFVGADERPFAGSVRENVAIAWPEAPAEKVDEALSRARCDEFVARLPQGADTRVGAGGAELSASERQRLAIARALLKDAPVVAVDEVVCASAREEELCHAAYAALAEGRTALVAARSLPLAAHADCIAVLRGGSVAEQGTHEELMSHDGPYRHLWDDLRTAEAWRVGRTHEA